MEPIKWVKSQKEGREEYLLTSYIDGKEVNIIRRIGGTFMAYYDGTASHNLASNWNHFDSFEEAEKEIFAAAGRGYANRR